MKKIYLLLSLLLFLEITGKSQITFERLVGDTCTEVAEKILTTPDSNYILLGNICTTTNNMDALVCKIDSFGNIIWSKTYGTVNSDYAYSICTTADSGYVISLNTLDTSLVNLITLIKINSLGDTVWTRTIKSNDSLNLNAHPYILRNYMNDYYVLVNKYDTSITLYDFDSNGNIDWAKEYSFSNQVVFTQIIESSNNSLILFGINGNNQYEILKIDFNGNIIWTKTYQNPDLYFPYSIKQTSDDGFIISAIINLSLLLIKTDSSANIEWANEYSDSISSMPFGFSNVIQTKDNGYLILSTVCDSAKICMIKTDSTGNILWSKVFGSGYNYPGERLSSLSFAIDSAYIFCGCSMSNGSFSNSNIYLVKTDYNGNSGCTAATSNIHMQQSNLNYIVSSFNNYFSIVTTSINSIIHVTPIILPDTDYCMNSGFNIYGKENQQILLCYPNPFDDRTTVKFDFLYGNKYSVSLYNAMGQLAKSIENINSGNIIIEKENLKNGFYFLQLRRNDEIIGSSKIIIK